MIWLAIAGPVFAEPYHWPLDLPCEITSSFGEYRTGRFHAGIDLRTSGIGRDVRAADDGYVSRVRCSPFGYGKAVYLRLRDGRSVVYAHLDDFYDELRDYVRLGQHAAKSYTVDLFPEAGRFPVMRGQVIAKSGQTGTGAPHLHYEIRDPAERPIHPRLVGVVWPDQRRPEIRRILIAPDGPASAVNGSVLPAVLDVEHLGGGRYRSAPVRVRGGAGFGADLLDPAPGGSRLGVYRMRLLEGDMEHFRLQHDVISYDDNHNAAVAYHPFHLSEGRFLLLWRWPGNQSASYAHSPGDGWLHAPETRTEVVIAAEDCAGNAASVVIPILPDQDAPEPIITGGGNGTGAAELRCVGTMLALIITFTEPEPEAPMVTVDVEAETLIPCRRVDERRFEAAFAPRRSGAHVLRAAHPRMNPFERIFNVALRGDAATRFALSDDVLLETKPSSPYGVIFAWMDEAGESPASPARRLSPVWRIHPAETPIDAPVTLSFPAPAGVERPERVHVYRLRGGGGWSCQDTTRDGGRFRIATRAFGAYALLEDDTPPVIANISAPQQYQAKTRRPIIAATITDAASGIASYEVTAGGVWLLTAYDPDQNRIVWERDHDLPSGPLEIIFRVTDKAGNAAIAKRTVIIPQ